MRTLNDVVRKRYNIGRTALYARLKALNIAPNKDVNNRSQITDKQLETLDKIDYSIKGGGTLKTFIPDSPVEIIEPQIDITSSPKIPIQELINFAVLPISSC